MAVSPEAEMDVATVSRLLAVGLGHERHADAEFVGELLHALLHHHAARRSGHRENIGVK
ncbi:MAG: hypothetical protein R2706_19780 [Acidimicrobiales bacterium]